MADGHASAPMLGRTSGAITSMQQYQESLSSHSGGDSGGGGGGATIMGALGEINLGQQARQDFAQAIDTGNNMVVLKQFLFLHNVEKFFQAMAAPLPSLLGTLSPPPTALQGIASVSPSQIFSSKSGQGQGH